MYIYIYIPSGLSLVAFNFDPRACSVRFQVTTLNPFGKIDMLEHMFIYIYTSLPRYISMLLLLLKLMLMMLLFVVCCLLLVVVGGGGVCCLLLMMMLLFLFVVFRC